MWVHGLTLKTFTDLIRETGVWRVLSVSLAVVRVASSSSSRMEASSSSPRFNHELKQ
jgi:hypothetical protein